MYYKIDTIIIVLNSSIINLWYLYIFYHRLQIKFHLTIWDPNKDHKAPFFFSQSIVSKRSRDSQPQGRRETIEFWQFLFWNIETLRAPPYCTPWHCNINSFDNNNNLFLLLDTYLPIFVYLHFLVLSSYIVKEPLQRIHRSR